MMLGSCYDQDPGWGGVGGMHGSDTLAMAEAPAATHRQAKCHPHPPEQNPGPLHTAPVTASTRHVGWAPRQNGGAPFLPRPLVWHGGADCHLMMSSRVQERWGAWR